VTPIVSSLPPVPPQTQSFEDFLQQVFVGISGLDPTLVRPRWQPEPPNVPDKGVDWLAIGITDWDPDTYAFVRHLGAMSDGADWLQRHETVNILASFYGPNASRNCGVLRDGFQIAQNREVLQANGIGLQETGTARLVPTLLKETWRYRVDMPIVLRRMILREYEVLNILTSGITVYNDTTPQLVSTVNVP